MGLTKNLLLWASSNPWMKEHVPRYSFVQRAVKRFMPGETLRTALEASQLLDSQGFSTVLTYLGENVTTVDEAMVVRDHYLSVLRTIYSGGHSAEISVKLTQLGLDVDEAQTLEVMRALLSEARRLEIFVWIDIESSPYVDRTLRTYELLRAEFSNVGICLQAYLMRTSDDLTSLLHVSPSVRLVKGAYREPTAIVYARKADVDRNYLALAERLLNELQSSETRIGIATHDTAIINTVKDIAARKGIPPQRFEFQMLYGIGKQTQQSLIFEGYRVRILISYGSAWYPWYVRRLAERPANVWFVVKSLFMK